jgi:Domain of unknown function (DUF4920)
MKQILILALCYMAISCNPKAATQVSESEAYEKFKTTSGDGKNFGEKFDTKGALTYDQAYKKLGVGEKLETKVMGTVESVCQAKGCWMTVQSAEGRDPLFVKFKNYGFFMPKDLSGQKVVMNGIIFKESTSVEMLQHLAEDAGKTQAEIEAIKSPKEEMKFTASGVVVVK